MPNAFPFSLSPFDCLDPDERRQVRGSVDIAYFPQQAVILEPGATPSHLFVIVKGYVQQMDEGEVVATLGPDDCFDGAAWWPGASAAALWRRKKWWPTSWRGRR